MMNSFMNGFPRIFHAFGFSYSKTRRGVYLLYIW